MSIQGSINSMLSSASHGVMAVKGYQELKQKEAEKAAKAATKPQAKKPAVDGTPGTGNEHMKANGQQQVKQKRVFMEYLKGMQTSLGGTVGDLPPQMQKAIASQYTKSQRRSLMDKMDKERANGRNL